MTMSEPIVSTGRGGAGNIGRDANIYAAGDITREGIEGVSADGEYSTGRGGAGNIGPGDGTPGTEERRRFSLFNRDASRSRSRSRARQGSRVRTDDVVVPETAMRSDDYKEYHTGRGGQGNVHKDKYGGHSTAAEQDRASRSSTPTIGGKVEGKLKHILGKK